MGQKNLEYSIYGALAAGVTLRPADEMRRLGLDVLKFEAMPIFDCIRVRVAGENLRLPSYISPLPDDYQFSDERLN